MKTLGEKIILLRKRLNINQKTLANMVEITEATLSRYENNKREPRGEIVTRLAKALNVTTDYLLNNESDLENQNLDDVKIFDIEKETDHILTKIETMKNLEFCGVIADDEDREYLKDAFQRFILDIKIYGRQKYTAKKIKK